MDDLLYTLSEEEKNEFTEYLLIYKEFEEMGDRKRGE